LVVSVAGSAAAVLVAEVAVAAAVVDAAATKPCAISRQASWSAKKASLLADQRMTETASRLRF
jgi:hypothetical protein